MIFLGRSLPLEIINTAFLGLLSLAEGIQLLIILGVVLSFFPPSSGNLSAELLAMDLKDLRPEHEMLLFRFFVAAVIGVFAALMWRFRSRLNTSLINEIKPVLMIDALLIAAQAYFILLIWIYGLAWPKTLVIGIALTAVLIKCFLRQAIDGARRFSGWLGSHHLTRPQRFCFDAFFITSIAVIIFVPDIETVLSNVFLQDHLYHFDSFYMSPGLDYMTGNTLNKDTVSLYSLISPIVMVKLANMAGGFNYENVLRILIGMSILYFICCYLFLRCWLHSVVLAAAGVLLAIKLQLFHYGVSPIIWRFPSATIARYAFDVLFFMLILGHMRKGKDIFLYGAGIVTGMALAYMTDTGMYLLAAFYSYLGLCIVIPALKSKRYKDLAYPFAQAVLPIGVAAGILWVFYGSTLLSVEFWHNTTEYISFFVHGFGSLPVYEYLKDKHVFELGIGLMMPAAYVLTIIIVGGLYWLKKIHKENILAVIIAVYGLCAFHYFINRSAMTSYYVVVVPFIFIVCFWVQKLLKGSSISTARRLLVSGVLGVIFVFGLNESFVFYPNALNIGQKDWKKDKAEYRAASDFKEDIALIEGLTRPNEKVVLISSFATKILLEAKRSPFFYYDPLITSRPMGSDNFAGGTYIHTKAALEKTVKQLSQKPPLIFIDKKMFGMELPMPYYKVYEILGFVAVFTHQQYDVIAQGKYLLALKRK